MHLALKNQLSLVLITYLEIHADLNFEILKIMLDFVSHKLDIFNVILQENTIRLPFLEEETMDPTKRQVHVLSCIEDILQVVFRKALSLDIQAVIDTGKDVLLSGGLIEQVDTASIWILSSHFLEIGWNYLAITSLVGP